MISYAQALSLLKQKALTASLPRMAVPLRQACGHVAAKEIRAGFSLPSFDNSAMDGFALNYEDWEILRRAGGDDMAVRDMAPAGNARLKLDRGTATQIMTGAVVPQYADTVIPIEDVDVVRAISGRAISIKIRKPPERGQHAREAGSDFRQGEAVVAAGETITPAHIMALAALGVAKIEVMAIPKIVVLATGNEIRDAEESGDGSIIRPEGGGIYNSSSPYLLASAQAVGAECEYKGIVRDDMPAFIAAMEKILAEKSAAPRIILSTGAVSMGDFDFVPSALDALGAKMAFHRVAIKPGKPILFAALENGDCFFGLPGNPVSSAVGFRFFVVPFLRALLEMPEESPSPARLSGEYAGKAGLRRFLKAKREIGADGTVRAQILAGQESFRVKPLLSANCWAVFGENDGKIEQDALVETYPLSP